LAADYPGVPKYRLSLGQIRINLAVANLVSAKKNLANGLFPGPKRSRPILTLGGAEMLVEEKDATGDDLYNAACTFASAAAHADAPTAERHAARAVAVLRQAFARGFHDTPRMLKDVDLDPLRQRADYFEL